MIDYWDIIFIFQYIAVALLIMVVLHALVFAAFSYLETGNPMIYLRNFYWNVYHIKI